MHRNHITMIHARLKLEIAFALFILRGSDGSASCAFAMCCWFTTHAVASREQSELCLNLGADDQLGIASITSAHIAQCKLKAGH